MSDATIWDIEFLENNEKVIIKTDKYNLIIQGCGDTYAFNRYGIQYNRNIYKFIGSKIKRIKGFTPVKEEILSSYHLKNVHNKNYKVTEIKYSTNFIIKIYGLEDLIFHGYYITSNKAYSYDFDAWIEIDSENHMGYLDEELKKFRQNISL